MDQEQDIPGGDPKIEENWWNSVLSGQGPGIPNEGPEVNPEIDLSADESVDWGKAQEVHDADGIIKVQVFGFNQGGVLVRGDWLHGFIPISHLNSNPGDSSPEARKKITRNYIGKTLNVKIIECNPGAKRIVLSERAGNASEGTRKRIISSLHPGDVVSGKVTNITNFGVFIDLGGIEGLAHVSELSWGKVQHPKDVVEIGQTVNALILNVNDQENRIGLSIKQLQPNPWLHLEDKYRPGDRLQATVTSITRYGIFVRLEEGVEGLIHNSVITKTSADQESKPHFTPGQLLMVQLLRIDAEHHRLGLSLVEEE